MILLHNFIQYFSKICTYHLYTTTDYSAKLSSVRVQTYYSGLILK